MNREQQLGSAVLIARARLTMLQELEHEVFYHFTGGELSIDMLAPEERTTLYAVPDVKRSMRLVALAKLVANKHYQRYEAYCIVNSVYPATVVGDVIESSAMPF